MGDINSPYKALLFIAVSSSDESGLIEIENILKKYYGPIKYKSSIFRFDKISQYYQEEMGPVVFKCFYIFERSVSLENFYRYKLESQNFEKLFAIDGKRRINIDPGSLTLYQLSLLTTKAFSHRTYLAEGIYAECTLIAEGNRYRELPWTYPDYKTDEALQFFAKAKEYLKSR